MVATTNRQRDRNLMEVVALWADDAAPRSSARHPARASCPDGSRADEGICPHRHATIPTDRRRRRGNVDRISRGCGRTEGKAHRQSCGTPTPAVVIASGIAAAPIGWSHPRLGIIAPRPFPAGSPAIRADLPTRASWDEARPRSGPKASGPDTRLTKTIRTDADRANPARRSRRHGNHEARTAAALTPPRPRR